MGIVFLPDTPTTFCEGREPGTCPHGRDTCKGTRRLPCVRARLQPAAGLSQNLPQLLRTKHGLAQVYFLQLMPTRLEEIITSTRLKVAAAKAGADLRTLTEAAERHPPCGFREALQNPASGIAVIAELKKASPSKGLIRADFPVSDLARELEVAGASALSVVTDEQYFQGSLQNLEVASEATDLPCLRKDFMVDEFQILEARAHRADAILLIVAALSDAELKALHARARELQLDVLCEVHDADELKRASNAGFDMIGVNNRNLHTFKVDLNTSLELAGQMPKSVVKVAESGIETREDIERLQSAGFNAFLIGESLMRAERPGDALRSLTGRSVVVPR